LSSTARLRIYYLSYLSNSAGDRPAYRAILDHRVRKILELGIGIGLRATRMIEVARHCNPGREIQFTAIDPFEARSAADGPGLSLKKAHRLLGATGARVRLVPGDPLTGLARMANALGQVDLVVISSRHDPRCLSRAWFYVPRLLHERSQVFLESAPSFGKRSLRLISRSEIENLAAVGTRRRAA